MQILLTGLFAIASAIGDVPANPAPLSAEGVYAIRAKTVVVGDGTVLTDGVVLVEGDLIRGVGSDLAIPEGAVTVEHDGVLTAGIVTPHSLLLSAAERTDSTDPFMPDLELRHGFDHDRDELDEALARGVTTAVLTGGDSEVVSGLAAVVQTHGGTVLEPRSHLTVSMTNSAANNGRYPTSYAGIIRELGARFGEGAEGRYAAARGGELPVLIHANANDECQRAMAFARANGLRGALLGPTRVGERLEDLRASRLGVVFPVLSAGSSERTLDAMVAVANSDVEFAFALTSPERLRSTAAMLVRHGANADRVWGALTAGGARIAGVDDHVGTLARGKRADLCLWSGHPLDLTSELVAVVIGGERVARPHAEHVHAHAHTGGKQ
ncbi:MAG: amidohydrolase family protein [Planctomycetota bacterium]